MLLQRDIPLATYCPRWWRLIFVSLLVVTVGVVIGLVRVQPSIGQAADKNDKVHSLLKERFAILKELVATTKTAYETDKATFGELTQVNAQLLAAELELCESDQERMVVHERAVDLAKEYEKATVELYKAARVTHSAVLAATANRLEAEIAYERAKARAGLKPN